MASLVSVAELAVVTQQEISPTDAFANFMLNAASLVVRDTAKHPEWTSASVPARAKLICTMLAARAFKNPDAIISEGIGPLTDTMVAESARTLQLTAAESAELVSLQGDGSEPGLSSGLWIQPTNGGLPLYPAMVFDNLGSDQAIPFLSETQVFAYPVDDPQPAPRRVPD